MPDPQDNQTPPELNLDEVVNLEPDKVTEEQKVFLTTNVDKLTSEQREKFGIEEPQIDVDKVEVETRGGKPKPPETTTPPGETEELNPDDEATVSKVVDKKMAPLVEQMQVIEKLKDEAEVDGFLRLKPEYTRYRPLMLKYLAHPAYADIPVKNIAAIVSAGDLQKIGAAKEREATEKVKQTQVAGNTVRKPTGKVDWLKASPEEVAAQKANVMGHP